MKTLINLIFGTVFLHIPLITTNLLYDNITFLSVVGNMIYVAAIATLLTPSIVTKNNE